MSVKASDEPGSEGGWYGEDVEKNMELFAKKSTSARFEDSEREDEHFHHPPHPVTMETASTGNRFA